MTISRKLAESNQSGMPKARATVCVGKSKHPSRPYVVYIVSKYPNGEWTGYETRLEQWPDPNTAKAYAEKVASAIGCSVELEKGWDDAR